MEVVGGHNFRRGIRGSRRCIKIALTSSLENPTQNDGVETGGAVNRFICDCFCVGAARKVAPHWTFYRWKRRAQRCFPKHFRFPISHIPFIRLVSVALKNCQSEARRQRQI